MLAKAGVFLAILGTKSAFRRERAQFSSQKRDEIAAVHRKDKAQGEGPLPAAAAASPSPTAPPHVARRHPSP